MKEFSYSKEPENRQAFTDKNDAIYSWIAAIYDISVKLLPLWKTWLKKTIKHIIGPRVLEVSFGTGYLMTVYGHNYQVSGIDFNEKMVATAKKNLKKKRVHADIQRGNVESLPFENDFFDTVLSTMAFSGYPDGDAAMSEMKRVLKPGGRLIILDVNYPSSRNFIGLRLVKMWQSAGDIIRDMSELFKKYDLEYSDEEVGGAGTVHLYVAQKNS